MDSRKVIKIEDSYYINIPSEISRALGIVKGDRLKIIHLPGSGLLITQAQGAGKVSVNLESIDRLQRAADFIYEQLKGRLKDLDSNFISGLHLRIIDDLVRSGIFDLKARVEKLETKSEVSDQGRGKLVLLHKKKRTTQ
jgi:bifunctional DNA-binding transcriptional regulator/antitoxin component of YhaV-PrlF toxin-antitoxin module